MKIVKLGFILLLPVLFVFSGCKKKVEAPAADTTKTETTTTTVDTTAATVDTTKKVDETTTTETKKDSTKK
jgi:hypothetical protein